MILLLACLPEQSPSSPVEEVVLETTEIVVPGPGIPTELVQQDSRNNLDIVEHQGRYYFAFRTAPNHFASPQTVLYLLSSGDAENWELETSFKMETDLREPRFLSWGERLFFYFAVLGDSPTAFEPAGMMVSERTEAGWSAPEPSYEDGFIPWRARTINDVPQLIGYTGGDNLYDSDGDPVRIHLLTTQDGRSWSGLVPGQPIVQEGGGSETDYVYLADGSLLAVSRNEAGDSSGFGSKICKAPADDLSDWTCASDPKKYDSPLLFRWGPQVWLVGRRNLTDTGNYDLGLDQLPLEEQAIQYEIAYWIEPKRCSLWTVDPQKLQVKWVLDLPSKGDTCFPSILPIDEHQAWIYNYSSPVDGPELNWSEGQVGETWIYRSRLRFSGSLP